jgi:hypothetical protein
MTTLTDVVAAVVVHSSAMAFSHFGVSVQPIQAMPAQPTAERVVARTPARKIGRIDCPDAQRARTEKV